jgi:Spy/CpxP family protein refolding chaperone
VTKTKVILLVSFAVVFAAGAAMGRLLAPQERERRRGFGPAEELGLTPEQGEQMRAIWSEVFSRLRKEHGNRRQELARERGEAVRELLTEEQREQYDGVFEEYERELRGLEEQRDAAVEEAVERTKEILTPEQREKYEEMLSRMRQLSGRPPRRRGPPRGGPWHGPPPFGAKEDTPAR